MGHVFISYSHKDKDYVHKLREALRNEGFDVWVDDRIDYGTTWPREIQRNLDDSVAFIVVMTDKAYESQWVQNEITRAQRKNKPFFALLLSGDTWLSLEAIQYENVIGGKLPSKKFFESLAAKAPSLKKQSVPLPPPKPHVSYKSLTHNAIRFLIMVVFIGIVALILNVVIRLGAHSPQPPVATLIVQFTATQKPLPTKTYTPTSTETSIPPTPTLGIDSTMISDKDGVTLMYVPAGNFTMGNNNGKGDEKPVHQVYLDAYWIDRTKVTNKKYSLCVSAGTCSKPVIMHSSAHSSYYDNLGFDDYPVIHVNWMMAKTYCEWAGRRLPTEAEWEKAARGTHANKYPWGNETPNNNLLNYNGVIGDTTQVDRYNDGASVYGILDMAGNAWEWVHDWYSETYYSNSPSSNPLGPESGTYRSARGGSWADDSESVLSYHRGWLAPTGTSISISFRCAMSVTP